MTAPPLTTTLVAAAALAGLLAAPVAAAPGPRCVILFAQDMTHPGTGERMVRVSAASDAGAGPDGIAVAKRLAEEAAIRTVHDMVEVLIVPLPEGSGGSWTPGDVTPETAALRLRHVPGAEDGAWSVLREGDEGAILAARAVEEMPAPPLAHFCDQWAMREVLTYALGG